MSPDQDTSRFDRTKRLSIETTVPLAGGSISVGIEVPNVDALSVGDRDLGSSLLDSLNDRAHRALPDEETF